MPCNVLWYIFQITWKGKWGTCWEFDGVRFFPINVTARQVLVVVVFVSSVSLLCGSLSKQCTKNRTRALPPIYYRLLDALPRNLRGHVRLDALPSNLRGYIKDPHCYITIWAQCHLQQVVMTAHLFWSFCIEICLFLQACGVACTWFRVSHFAKTMLHICTIRE